MSVLLAPRSALFLPASNPRAVAKARTLAADMILLDLEDAVKDDDKDMAREAAVAALEEGFGGKPVAIRINGRESGWHRADLLAVAASKADYVVLPKVESAAIAIETAQAAGKPLLAMIETPRGLLEAAAIAGATEVAGLLAGTNDLSATLGTPPGDDRRGLLLALQTIVLAARAGEAWALDGVFNRLDDPAGLAAQCAEGRLFGFDGKTLIHPNQVEIANRGFGAGEAELADARALVAAATGGAERFAGRMIESMHVEQARALIARAELSSAAP